MKDTWGEYKREHLFGSIRSGAWENGHGRKVKIRIYSLDEKTNIEEIEFVSFV